MATCDIESLFTNIPLDETIDIAANHLFESNKSVLGLSEEHFRTLLMLAVKICHFICNDNIYKQLDGVAMGNPLVLVLANIFLCYHETKWLNNCPPGCKPNFYKRYIDDTFLLFDINVTQAENFTEYLNMQHQNMRFSLEIERNNCFPFLGIDVTHKLGQFVTSVYRKSMFTGLYLNFTAVSQ